MRVRITADAEMRPDGEMRPGAGTRRLTVGRVIHMGITMPHTASVRDLRNRFPRVRKILEAEGEVLLTESGEAKYRLTPYTKPPGKAAVGVDYWARLTATQPVPITAAQARALHEENRGER